MDASCSSDRCGSCPGRVVCRCLNVTENELVTLIDRLGLRSVKEIRTHSGAGDGCTCCHPQIRSLLAQAECEATAAVALN